MNMRPATNSGRKTADAAIAARPCALKGLLLEGDGTNAASIILYDNASAASGTVICKLFLPAPTTAIDVVPKSAFLPFPDGVECINGIYADVTGTNAAYNVYFALE